MAWYDDWDDPPRPTMVEYDKWVPKERLDEYLKRNSRKQDCELAE
jgi:hypothetical protein